MPTVEKLEELKEKVLHADVGMKDAEDELRTAERAGMDVSTQRAKLEETKTKLRRVKTAYNI